jgi:hypothetical protein
MAVRMLSGTAITMAITVTQRVPAMKEAKPNSPLSGCHKEEKRSALSGLISRMGLDRQYNPPAMRKARLRIKEAKRNIILALTVSFNPLKVIFTFLPLLLGGH